jgi:di/tricarboxylate transporter
MDKNMKFLVCCVVVAFALNLVLPHLVAPFATPEQMNPPHGVKDLSFFSQIMHMLVHHSHIPVSSGVVVALIVALTVTIARHCL